MKTRTPIIADKEIFRLWYEFYRLATKSADPKVQRALLKSKKFYSEWDFVDEHYDDWWRTHRHLFHDNDLVSIFNPDDKRSANRIYISIPIDKSYGQIFEEISELIKVELPLKKKGRKEPLSHKYSPTEIQGVKRDSLRIMLDLQKNIFSKTELKGGKLTDRVIKFFESERYKRKRNRVPMSFAIEGTHIEEAQRNIRRYRQKAKNLIMNVATGEFPGKY